MLSLIVKDDKVTPNRLITREEMCSVVVSAYEYAKNTTLENSDFSPIDKEAIRTDFLEAVGKAYTNRIVQGMLDNTFAPEKNETKAEAVTIILNMLNL